MKKPFKRVLVISYDSLSSFDMDLLGQLPNFRKLLKGSYYCPYVKSVYPSLTYPAHTSIVTGKLPKDHGIIGNTLPQYDRESPDWYWQRAYITGETIYDLAKKAGRRTGALLWPVTAKANIDYHMPEIFSNREGESQVSVSLKNGSPLFQIGMVLKHGRLRDGKKQPALDHFVQAVLKDLLKKGLGLTLAHFTDLDTHRHLHGTFSREAEEAIRRHDQRLGEVLEELKSRNQLEGTALVVLGDHASLDTHTTVRLNPLLARHNFLRVDPEGRLKDYEFIVKSSDGSAYIYENAREEGARGQERLKEERRKELRAVLEEQIEKEILEKIYTKEEAAEFGADPKCLFLLEAAKGYYFMDGFTGDYLEETAQKAGYENHFMLSTHGYSPEKPDYGTVFFVATDLEKLMAEEGTGPLPESLETFRKEGTGNQLENLCLTDEFSVLKELLGLE